MWNKENRELTEMQKFIIFKIQSQCHLSTLFAERKRGSILLLYGAIHL